MCAKRIRCLNFRISCFLQICVSPAGVGEGAQNEGCFYFMRKEVNLFKHPAVVVVVKWLAELVKEVSGFNPSYLPTFFKMASFTEICKNVQKSL